MRHLPLTTTLLFSTLFFSTWFLFQHFIPASPYWRDSGEFIIAATALDVSHPAGFPLYAQIANLFALIPFGPIAWRVNAFSCFLSLSVLALSFAIAFQILVRDVKLSSRSAFYLSFIPVILLLGCSGFLRQSLSAEVYLLNTVVIQILFLCYHRWLHCEDLRYLLLACFLAGLGLGNHASLGLVLLPILLLVFIDYKKTKEVLLSGFMFGLLGLMVYSYLPMRASVNPPLNTGKADSFERLINLVTDKRDREIRYGAAVNEVGDQKKVTIPGLQSKHKISYLIEHDLGRIKQEFPVWVLAAALLGSLILFVLNWRVSFVLLSVALGNWYFFAGWGSDPWTPLLMVVSCLALLVLGKLLQLAENLSSTKPSFLPILALLVCIVACVKLETLDRAYALKKYDLPQREAHHQMRRSSPNTVFLIEPSWFLFKYVQFVEGYRDDVVLTYLPSLSYPELFNPLLLENGKEQFSSLGLDLNSFSDDSSISIEQVRLQNFLSFVGPSTEIRFEPIVGLNQYLKKVAQLGNRGVSKLAYKQAASFSHTYYKQRLNDFGLLLDEIRTNNSIVAADARHYTETMAVNTADILLQLGTPLNSLELLKTVCLSQEIVFCSSEIINNISAYSINTRRYKQAAEWALRGLAVRPSRRSTLQENLKLSLYQLSAKELDELRQNPVWNKQISLMLPDN